MIAHRDGGWAHRRHGVMGRRCAAVWAALAAAAVVALPACQSDQPAQGPNNAWVAIKQWDDQTRYRATPLGDAFKLQVFYPRTTEGLPSSVVSYMQRVVPKIAKSYAAKRGHAIQPIDAKQIDIVPGRNPMAGTTVWYAAVVVQYDMTSSDS